MEALKGLDFLLPFMPSSLGKASPYHIDDLGINQNWFNVVRINSHASDVIYKHNPSMENTNIGKRVRPKMLHMSYENMA